jgi:hypothetical protein
MHNYQVFYSLSCIAYSILFYSIGVPLSHCPTSSFTISMIKMISMFTKCITIMYCRLYTLFSLSCKMISISHLNQNTSNVNCKMSSDILYSMFHILHDHLLHVTPISGISIVSSMYPFQISNFIFKTFPILL